MMPFNTKTERGGAEGTGRDAEPLLDEANRQIAAAVERGERLWQFAEMAQAQWDIWEDTAKGYMERAERLAEAWRQFPQPNFQTDDSKLMGWMSAYNQWLSEYGQVVRAALREEGK